VQQEEGGVGWCFPELSPDLQKTPDAVRETSPLCIEKELEAAQIAEDLSQQQRALACRRMSRSFAGSPSAISHADRKTHEKNFEGSQGSVKSHGDSWAAAVGTAIHAALEAFDFEMDPQDAWAQQDAALVSRLTHALPAELCAEALVSGQALWEGFRSGPLFQSFLDAGNSECLRELDVLIPVDPVEESGPVGVYTGSIDLLYRDAAGEVVVVDYKTDAVGDAEQVKERAANYLEQGRLYQRAVREALKLNQDPRFELWFIRPGIVWSADNAG
jgi:ATP-dependent exoDNAse (exonuclease V) beta subunit